MIDQWDQKIHCSRFPALLRMSSFLEDFAFFLGFPNSSLQVFLFARLSVMVTKEIESRLATNPSTLPATP